MFKALVILIVVSWLKWLSHLIELGDAQDKTKTAQWGDRTLIVLNLTAMYLLLSIPASYAILLMKADWYWQWYYRCNWFWI